MKRNNNYDDNKKKNNNVYNTRIEPDDISPPLVDDRKEIIGAYYELEVVKNITTIFPGFTFKMSLFVSFDNDTEGEFTFIVVPQSKLSNGTGTYSMVQVRYDDYTPINMYNLKRIITEKGSIVSTVTCTRCVEEHFKWEESKFEFPTGNNEKIQLVDPLTLSYKDVIKLGPSIEIDIDISKIPEDHHYDVID
jgi:hypothetical protein